MKKKKLKKKALKAKAGVTLHPSCNPPYGNWNGTVGACDCTGEWFGESCEKKHCADYDEASGKPDCSAHGMCVKGDCFCAAGWGLGPGKAGVNVCEDPICPIDCGPHGMCQENLCVCQDGWQGPACREPKCQDDCTGHGTCTFTLANSPAECVCEYGWALPTCASKALYSKLNTCPNACSGSGLCMNGRCLCMEGTSGMDCAGVVCPAGTSGPACQYRACPRDCSGYGICFNGECSCDEYHLGPDCSIPRQCFEACHEVCMPDLAGERCEFCKGQCLTLASNPVVGKHNPMLARLYSALQTSNRNPTGHGHQKKKATSSRNPHRLRRRHVEVSAVQTGHHAPKKAHHAEVSAVKIGHYTPGHM